MIEIKIWEEGGRWEWDIRWAGPPAVRSTGNRATLPETMAEVRRDVLEFAGEPA